MCARLDVLSTARAFATDYVRQNPKATEDQVVVATSEHIDDLRKNGDKFSARGRSKVQSTVREVYTAEQARANFAPVAPEAAQRAAKKFNANAAVNHYEQILGMGDGARKKWHNKNMTDAKAAFASEDYLEVLKRNNPAEYEKEVARLKAENETVSNNAGKKEANAEYQSSKKKKAAKKAGEAASQAEHRKERVRNSKPAREARYMTENGLMKTEGRKLYRALANHEIVADAPFEWNNAEASARVFEEHGLTDLEKKLLKEEKTAASASAKKAVETAAETASNAAKPVEKAVEQATKSSKGKWGWIAGGVGLVAAAIGGKSYMDNKKAQEQQLNLSA
ncbi:MAG: hypothetical protein NC390_02705 [Fusobacterium sp.]|nr:hypothetical protein [Fusobacterium sp.]